ncbi:MutS-related protein [Silvibacterium dinghuense]|uniref:DNA mismatch repair protein MutS n=1 Tax=Silvibacterium dinghuense TaxID=1560006 RepID=A0A4Q1SC74_9BACT|nr:DNA mismatch repair protein MutS [Silvibacterium dinghuense]RXS94573.1 DNA mismatch repair protein MutS [Silvibacterium dinghuense]GGH15263.1 DNA mismatch repair protein [Silvibacterium dinghuense]
MSEPQSSYRARIDALATASTGLKSRDRSFVTAKIITGIILLALAIWLMKYQPAHIAWILLPAACFVALAIAHERVLRRLRQHTRLAAYYERGMARIENRWATEASTDSITNGLQFLDPHHPYARDLDLFGPGSLFQLLSTARTAPGEETLAAWLQQPAPISEITLRQQAIRELAPQLDLRETLVLAGEEAKGKLHPDALIAWAEAPSPFRRAALRTLFLGLDAAWVASLLAWWQWRWPAPALALSLINIGVSYKFRERMLKAASGVEGAQHDLALLAAILAPIERHTFAAGKLHQLQSRLTCSGICASKAIADLTRRLAWLESNDNWFVKLLNLFCFWTPLCTLAIDAWRARFGPSVRDWLAVAGEMEALTSLAVYTYEHPTDIFPTLIAPDTPRIEAEDLAHPLLARDKAIGNDLALSSASNGLQLIVVSGPNMAGKSTFMRALGLNIVLAQAGAPVFAKRLALSPLQVAASICVLDSLQGGLSRFYAEISRLKQIDDLARAPMPVLFLLDELLSGTNSHDRRTGTERFVRGLLTRGAVGLVTTHDLALAEIAEQIGPHAANYHFADTFDDGKLHFDYKLTPGIVQTANALLLMRSIGLEV